MMLEIRSCVRTSFVCPRLLYTNELFFTHSGNDPGMGCIKKRLTFQQSQLQYHVTLPYSIRCLIRKRLCTSVAGLAETSLRSPPKLFIFIIKKLFIGSKYPKNKLFNFDKTSLLCTLAYRVTSQHP